MKTYTLEKEDIVAAPLAEVFSFFEKASNLEAITPPFMKMTTLTPAPIDMHPGQVIDYAVRVRGVTMRWTSIITDYDPPHRFVDVQLRGPYSFWHHTHTFEARGEHTWIHDRVVYALPFGPGGRVARALFVHRDLVKIFAFRQQVMREKFGAV